MKTKTLLLVSAAVLAMTGCVSQGKYDEAVAKTQVTQAQLTKTQGTLDAADAEVARERDEIMSLQARIDSLTAQSAQSQTDLSKSSQNIDELRARLEELKAARSASEQRAALFRSLALKLKDQVDAGDLQIVLRDGRMVIQLPNDVLFDTGKTDIKPAGAKALKAIASALKTVQNRQFQIAGHTDNVPIHTERFSSNWELSSGRALRVVHFLVDEGVAPTTLSAAGYADVDPVAPNDSTDNKKRNRRTEITLQPNIHEMVRVP